MGIIYINYVVFFFKIYIHLYRLHTIYFYDIIIAVWKERGKISVLDRIDFSSRHEHRIFAETKKRICVTDTVREIIVDGKKKRGLTRFTIASELSYTRVIWGEIACNICHCRDGIILRARKRVREKKKREYRLWHMWATRDVVFYRVRIGFVMILWHAYFSRDLERLDFAHRKLSQFFSFFFFISYTYMNKRIVWCMSVEMWVTFIFWFFCLS